MLALMKGYVCGFKVLWRAIFISLLLALKLREAELTCLLVIDNTSEQKSIQGLTFNEIPCGERP